jgi:TPP-dependent pyruvate/acetoin dehydrogenase alpha subunit
MKRSEMIEQLGKKKCVDMYRRMLEIREFEEKIRFLFLEGKMPGTVHQYIGMEACAVGVCAALGAHDVIASTHRPHGHAIARGVPMDAIMGELYGKITGCCGGKGGSMHVGDLSKGMLPAIAIVGGNMPITMGMGLAFKLKGEPRVAVSFFGDGASNEGAFHEALNMASLYGVPAVFVCENNLYAASTSIKRATKIENIADRAAAYGMRGDIADGMKVLDVYEHALEAVERARGGGGPTLLELKAFRLCGHSRRDPNNYMSEEEKALWQSKDPIPGFEKLLLGEGLLTAEEVKGLKGEVEASVDRAIEAGQKAKEPEASALYEGLYVNMEVPR